MHREDTEVHRVKKRQKTKVKSERSVDPASAGRQKFRNEELTQRVTELALRDLKF